MLNKMANDLLVELNNAGHRLYAKGSALRLRQSKSQDLTDQQRARIKALKPQLLWIVADAEVKAAFKAAVDAITATWPRGGPAPAPSLAVVAAEAVVDRESNAQPIDVGKALAAIDVWRRAWCDVVKQQREGG